MEAFVFGSAIGMAILMGHVSMVAFVFIDLIGTTVIVSNLDRTRIVSVVIVVSVAVTLVGIVEVNSVVIIVLYSYSLRRDHRGTVMVDVAINMV